MVAATCRAIQQSRGGCHYRLMRIAFSSFAAPSVPVSYLRVSPFIAPTALLLAGRFLAHRLTHRGYFALPSGRAGLRYTRPCGWV